MGLIELKLVAEADEPEEEEEEEMVESGLARPEANACLFAGFCSIASVPDSDSSVELLPELLSKLLLLEEEVE